MIERINEWLKQWKDGWMNEWMNELTKEGMNELINELNIPEVEWIDQGLLVGFVLSLYSFSWSHGHPCNLLLLQPVTTS